MRGGEVLPLQQYVRQFSAHRLNEPTDELVVGGTADTAMPPAEVHRVVKELSIVGANIEENGQSAGRVDPTQRRVQRQLPDRDAHAADALVTAVSYTHLDVYKRQGVSHGRIPVTMEDDQRQGARRGLSRT